MTYKVKNADIPCILCRALSRMERVTGSVAWVCMAVSTKGFRCLPVRSLVNNSTILEHDSVSF